VIIDVDPARKLIDKVDACQDKKFPLLYVFAFEPSNILTKIFSSLQKSLQMSQRDTPANGKRAPSLELLMNLG
jgi:hypothetical protein